MGFFGVCAEGVVSNLPPATAAAAAAPLVRSLQRQRSVSSRKFSGARIVAGRLFGLGRVRLSCV